MDTKELKKQYFAARKELEFLEGELPNYEKLLSDNQAEENKLRKTKAKLDELAIAKTRVQAARELLEQHHHDIQTAKAEADRLGALYQQALTIDEMAQHAKEAEGQHQALSAALVEADAALKPLMQKLYTHWRGLLKAREDFNSTGLKISRAFGRNSWAGGMSSESIRGEEAKLEAALAALKAREVDAAAARTPYRGNRLISDTRSAELEKFPRLEYSLTLWQQLQRLEQAEYDRAVRELRAKDAARREQRKQEEQKERQTLEVVIDLKHQEEVKRAADMIGNRAMAAHEETRTGNSSLAVWTIRKRDAVIIDSLKAELGDVVTVRGVIDEAA